MNPGPSEYQFNVLPTELSSLDFSKKIYEGQTLLLQNEEAGFFINGAGFVKSYSCYLKLKDKKNKKICFFNNRPSFFFEEAKSLEFWNSLV